MRTGLFPHSHCPPVGTGMYSGVGETSRLASTQAEPAPTYLIPVTGNG